MQRILYFLAALVLLCASCRFGSRRVRGNGHLATEERHVTHANRIALSGSFDVQLTQGPATTVKIEADENLLSQIATVEEGGVLHIRPKRKNTNFESDHNLIIYITTPSLEQVHINGSGSATGKNKFTGGDRLSLKILGSGDIDLEVNTPEIKSNIGGSGTIILRGETRSATIDIGGAGTYTADGLKAEDARVKIAGSGDVKVFADATLDVSIMGAGSVLYRGTATVKQKIVGGGEIRKLD
jgi:hypothetical protein